MDKPYVAHFSPTTLARYFSTVDGRTPSEPSQVLQQAKTHFSRGKLAVPSIPSTYKEWPPPHLYASCRFPDCCPHRALLPRQRTPATTNQTTQKTMLNHEARCNIIHQERQARTQARNKQQAVVLASLAVTSNRHPRTSNTSRQRAQAYFNDIHTPLSRQPSLTPNTDMSQCSTQSDSTTQSLNW
jgi:hypothetical protein